MEFWVDRSNIKSSRLYGRFLYSQYVNLYIYNSNFIFTIFNMDLYIHLPTSLFLISGCYRYVTKTYTKNISFIYLIILNPTSIFQTFYILYLTLLYIMITSSYIYLLISVKRRKLYNFLSFILFSVLYIPLYEIILIYDIIYYGIFERAPKMNWKV